MDWNNHYFIMNRIINNNCFSRKKKWNICTSKNTHIKGYPIAIYIFCNYFLCLQVCTTIWVKNHMLWLTDEGGGGLLWRAGKSPWVWRQIRQVASSTPDHKAARECCWLTRTKQEKKKSVHPRIRTLKPNPKHGEYQAFLQIHVHDNVWVMISGSFLCVLCLEAYWFVGFALFVFSPSICNNFLIHFVKHSLDHHAIQLWFIPYHVKKYMSE